MINNHSYSSGHCQNGSVSGRNSSSTTNSNQNIFDNNNNDYHNNKITQNSIQTACFSIYHNNCRGLLSKRHRLANSNIISENQVIFLSETKISSNSVADQQKLDFSNVNRCSKSLSLCRQEGGNLFGGSCVIWDPTFINIEHLTTASSDIFEINSVRITTKSNNDGIVDKVTVIYCYKSPSFTLRQNEQFIITLDDIVNKIEGRKLIVGDFNWLKNRKRHGVNEKIFLDYIESLGCKSKFSGATRLSNQLDYVFSNFDVNCSKEEGLRGRGAPSDHDGIRIDVLLEYQIKFLPETVLTSRGKLTKTHSAKAHEWMLEAYEWLFDENYFPGIDINAIFCYASNMINDIYDHYYEPVYRVLPARKIVKGYSRQQSRVILDSNMPLEEKERQLKILNRKELARRTKKKILDEKSFSLRLRNTFGAAPKIDKTTACNIPPDEFGEELVREEKADLLLHLNGSHDDWSGANADLILDKIPFDKFLKITNKLKNKWRRYFDYGFDPGFWWAIAQLIGTERDKGVYSFSYVKTVPKDKSKSHLTSGHRPVWEPANPFEKVFDLLKVCLLRVENIPNAAYSEDRSTVRAISLALCWQISSKQGVFGIDFVKAFNKLCRSCLNDSINYKFIPPDIFCQFATALGSSKIYNSVVGSGAGRPSGGNIFNLGYYGVIRKKTKLILDKTEKLQQVMYADDSLAVCDISIAELEKYIDEMRMAKSIGLQIHDRGKKGPCLLVHENCVDETTAYLQQSDADINVEPTIKFLGLNFFISKNYNVLVATIPKETRMLLSFLVQHLKEHMQVVYNNLDNYDAWRAFETASQAASCFIESRIMMAVMFCSLEDLNFLYSIHRRLVAALAGIPLKFFNFKCRSPVSLNKKEFVPDLLSTICGPTGLWSNGNLGMQSKSYVRLCECLGRPTLAQIAIRQFKVIMKQTTPEERATAFRGDKFARVSSSFNCPFIKKLKNFQDRIDSSPEVLNNNKPKTNKWYIGLKSLRSTYLRYNYIKIACDRGLAALTCSAAASCPRLQRHCGRGGSCLAGAEVAAVAGSCNNGSSNSTSEEWAMRRRWWQKQHW